MSNLDKQFAIQFAIKEQLRWMKDCGRTLPGYLAHYETNGLNIYDADIHELQRLKALRQEVEDALLSRMQRPSRRTTA